MDALTALKLETVDKALRAMYGARWINRWPVELFREHWGPIVSKVDAQTLGVAVARMVQTRTDKTPPLPAEFAELLKADEAIEPAPDRLHERRSAATEEHVRQWREQNPWLNVTH